MPSFIAEHSNTAYHPGKSAVLDQSLGAITKPSSDDHPSSRILANGEAFRANSSLPNGAGKTSSIQTMSNGHAAGPEVTGGSWGGLFSNKTALSSRQDTLVEPEQQAMAPNGSNRAANYTTHQSSGSNGTAQAPEAAKDQNGARAQQPSTNHAPAEVDTSDGSNKGRSTTAVRPKENTRVEPQNDVGSSKTSDSFEDGSLQVPRQAHRASSPPAVGSSTNGLALEPSTSPTLPGNRLQHRHTLEVPKVSTLRTSRDFQTANNTDDVGSATGRFSPNTPTRRRGSMTLVRRATRSITSELHLDGEPQDEDAERWAEAIKQKRASKRRRKEEEDDDRVVVGTKVDQNHVNWVTAYNMLTGIRFTVSRTNAKMDRDLTDADFAAKHKFSFDITGNELTPSAKYDFKFKDYAPWVFRHLRQTFGLDPADYLMSLTSKYILSELGSPGKSGSFFYFSRDYKYIIKTIHHAEHKFLRRILKDYYDHVRDNPNTLLSQFYGLHRVKIPYGRKIHFVVMNNLFPPHRDIHRTFDLKGSTIGRDFREEELERNPRATLKDLNWLRRNLHLEFGPAKRKAFLDQMERDVALMRRLKIMDYSMLIGIHDLERGNEEKLRDKTLQVFQPGGDEEEPQPGMLARTPSKLENIRKAKEMRQILKIQKPVPMDQSTSKMPDEMPERKGFYFYSDDGGFRATHEDNRPGDVIYYLGIIDCLTYYSMIKRSEHFYKGLSNPESQISAVPPDRYGDRFVKFITGITKTRERAEQEKRNEQDFIDDPRLSGVNLRTSTEIVMEKAERQAEKSMRHGASEKDVPDRTIHAVTGAGGEREGVSTTLPVVEEAAESQSMGGRSGRSGRSQEPSPQPPQQGYKPPPTPPKDSSGEQSHRPPTPPKDYQGSMDGPPTPPKDERRGRDKTLPLPPPVVADGYTQSPTRTKQTEMADSGMRMSRVS